MISNVDLFFQEEVYDDSRDLAKTRRYLRDNSNPLELDDLRFKMYFRLNKIAFKMLLDEIKPKFKTSTGASSIPPIIKLSAALRFFAEGGYQKGTGNDFNVGLAQSTMSVVILEVLSIFEQHICPKWINIYMTETEKCEAKQYFYVKTDFPGVIGCVDGTHIKIVEPKKEIRHLYLNRKGYYSLNVMIACDHKMRIRAEDRRYPGANHDSFVWNNSSLKRKLDENFNNGEQNTWFLGDSGYPLLPYLETPFRTTAPDSIESRFNKKHSKARNIIERTIGVCKNRFRCILGARELHYSPEKVTKIVNACCALHNICIFYNVANDDLEDVNTYSYSTEDNTDENLRENVNQAAVRIRNNIMNSF